MRRRSGLVGVLAWVTVGILLVSPPFAVADSGDVPTFLRTLGGPLHASVYPGGVEVAPDGGIVAADTGNDVVTKYHPDGTLAWRVGQSGVGVGRFQEPRDVGVDAAGNAYVADATNRRIVKLGPGGGWIGSWTGPSGEPMGVPIGITVTNGKVYVADSSQNSIRVFDTAGNQLLRFGSNGACNLTGARDADADAAGNIYVAAYAANQVAKLDEAGTCITTWGTRGTANGQFKNPYGVRIANDPVLGGDRVFVADANNGRVQEFTLAGAFVKKAGMKGEPTEPGTFTALRRVAVAADGDIWGADLWGYQLERFNRTSTGYSFAQAIGTPLPAPTSDAVFHEVREVDFQSDGTVVAIDTVHHRFVRMTPWGSLLNVCGERGSAVGELNWPRGVAVDRLTNQVWITDTKQYRIQVVRPDCTPVEKFGSKGTGPDQFNWVYSMDMRQSDGIAFIADTKNHRISFYDISSRTPVGTPFGKKGAGVGRFNFPSGVAVSPHDGHVFVADTNNNRVVELAVTSSGAVSWIRVYTGFLAPNGVAVDPEGTIYVADTGNDRVVLLHPGGSVRGILTGNDGFTMPSGVAVAGNGDVYVSDTYEDEIEVFRWT
jgi:DNA-binding beta-propeller fold protein YncE